MSAQLSEQLKRLDNMILAMEAHGILSYFGMPLEDLKSLAEFIRENASGDIDAP